MGVYLRATFEVSSITLTGFRQGRYIYHPYLKKPTQIRVKGAFLIHLSRKVPAATETLIFNLRKCRIHVETLSQKTLQV